MPGTPLALWGPYFYEFATHSYENSNIYQICRSKLIYGGVFFVCMKNTKKCLLPLRKTFNFLDSKYAYFNFYAFMV